MELADFHPISVMGGIPAGESVEFLHPQGRAAFEESPSADLVWAILDKCNGTYSAEEICELLPFDANKVASVMGQLQKGGVLLDKRQAWRHFHLLTGNPSPYPESPFPRSPQLRGFKPDALNDGQVELLLRSAYDYSSDIQLTVLSVSQSLGGAGRYSVCAGSWQLEAPYDEAMLDRLGFALDSDTRLYGAPLAIVVSICPQNNHDYRSKLVGAGRVVERIDIAAQMLGLQAVEHTSFNDSALQALLSGDEQAVPVVVVGVGAASPTSVGSQVEQEFEQLRTALVGFDRPVEKLWVALGDNLDPAEQRYSVFATRQPTRQVRDLQSRATMATGASTAHAGLKAIAEAVERTACTSPYWDVEAPAAALDGPWIDPQIIAPYTAIQQKQLRIEPFSPNDTTQWVRGYDVASHKPVYIPASLVFYGGGQPFASRTTSSGVAASMTTADATRRALLELLERDAIMRHWLSGNAPGRLPLYVHDQRHLDKIRYWQRQGRTAEVLNLSHDGIAIVVVMIHSKEYPCLTVGSAASDESLQAAIAKAFDEAELALRFALWADPVEALQPNEVRQPLDHAKLFYYPTFYKEVSWFWQGPIVPKPDAIQPVEQLLDLLKPVAIDFRGELAPLRVVRVMSPQLLPANFGWGNDHRSHHTLPQWVRDQVPFPHFLA